MKIDLDELGNRRFLIVSHRTPPDGDFSLNDLPGSGGRVDIIARFITSSLLASNSIRRDASAAVYFAGGVGKHVAVIISGRSVKYLNPDERSTSALLRNALVRSRKELEGVSSPGVYFIVCGLSELAEIMIRGCSVYLLKENGESTGPEIPGLYVVGDIQDISEAEENAFSSGSLSKVSISKYSLQSDQCAVIVNWLLDNRSRGAAALDSRPSY